MNFIYRIVVALDKSTRSSFPIHSFCMVFADSFVVVFIVVVVVWEPIECLLQSNRMFHMLEIRLDFYHCEP